MLPRPSVLAPVLAVSAGISSAQQEIATFTDESERWAVLFEHDDGFQGYAMGGGVAVLDYDNDGDPDLLCTSSDGNHRLGRNDGDEFVDVTEKSGLTLFGNTNTMGAIVGDWNQDGWSDVYFTNNGPNWLFTNMGDGQFVEQGAGTGITGNEWSMSASFADFDRDGDLELYVGNYIGQLYFPYHTGDPNQLYVNEGTVEQPMFVDRAPELGVDNVGLFGPAVPGFEFVAPTGLPTAGCTLSVCTSDFDVDGDPDLMVGNDFGQFVISDRLYRNDTPQNGALSFADISESSGFGENGHYNMGINGADYDHDGDWDYYLSNLGDNLLLQNDGNGNFTNVVDVAGPVDGETDDGSLLLTSWTTVWADFDNDMWEDLFVVNGHIPAATFIDNDFRATNHIWMNNADGTFTRMDPSWAGITDRGAGRGGASLDANDDGWMDLYSMNNGAPGVALQQDRCRLFINNGAGGDVTNSWLKLSLTGWKSNIDGFGARIDVDVAGQTLKRELLGDPVFISSSTRDVHFGLGQNGGVDRVTIDWPSGLHQELVGVPGRRSYDLLEPRVTLDQAHDAAWSNGVLTWAFDLTNHADEPLDAAISVFLFFQDGPQAAVLPLQASLLAGESRTVTLDLPLGVDVQAALAGTSFDQYTYVGASGAIDSREIGYTLN